MLAENVVASVSTGIVELLRDKLVPDYVLHTSRIIRCHPKPIEVYTVGFHLYGINSSSIKNDIDDSQNLNANSIELYYMISIGSRGEFQSEDKILNKVMNVMKSSPFIP